MFEMEPGKKFQYRSVCKQKVSSVDTFALFQPKDDIFSLVFFLPLSYVCLLL